MKRLFLLSFVLVQSILSNGQVNQTLGSLLFADTLNFRPLHSWITIDNPESNIWKVGQPNKLIFNAAYKGKFAMITDSTISYSNNLNDCFYITIPLNYQWGEGILSFYHKFDTDTLTDGGAIETSYDNGINWENINTISSVWPAKKLIGIYNDTIKGGIYGYSGKSKEWKYAEIYWLWLMRTKQPSNVYPMIRFRFVSDNINTNKDGWMIDDIVFRGYSITGNVNESSIDEIKAYPNPSDGLINFTISENLKANAQVELCDILGRLVFTHNLENRQIDIRYLDSGIYTYKIYQDNKIITFGKLIKN